MTISNEPLVSVIVITYNSSKYIKQTLDSIARQDYKNIELIVSDDHSVDDTLSVVYSWITDNKQRFVDVTVVTFNCNTGVSGNCNRGMEAAKGEFIKIIGGDDMLMPNYMTLMINGIADNDIAFCYVYLFRNENEISEGLDKLDYMPKDLLTYSLSKHELYKKQLIRNDYNAPAALIRKTVFSELGAFDEKYAFMEDLPFWLKCVRANKKICFVDTFGVLYRRSDDSISKVVSQFKGDIAQYSTNQSHFKNDFDRFMKVRKHEMRKCFMWRRLYLNFGDDYCNTLASKLDGKYDWIAQMFRQIGPHAKYLKEDKFIRYNLFKNRQKAKIKTQKSKNKLEVNNLKELNRLRYRSMRKLLPLKFKAENLRIRAQMDEYNEACDELELKEQAINLACLKLEERGKSSLLSATALYNWQTEKFSLVQKQKRERFLLKYELKSKEKIYPLRCIEKKRKNQMRILHKRQRINYLVNHHPLFLEYKKIVSSMNGTSCIEDGNIIAKIRYLFIRVKVLIKAYSSTFPTNYIKKCILFLYDVRNRLAHNKE